MIIGGLQKFSLLDYPEHISAIIFAQGCNYRCQFCYNPMLVRPVGEFKDTSSVVNAEKRKGRFLPEADLFAFLRERKGKLDAVVITGGEPTIQADLPEFLEKIKKYGYKIKLDTNGTKPEMIRALVKKGLLDYIAMDMKAAPENHEQVTGVKADLAKIKKSIKIIRESGLPYEFRTTLVPGLHSEEDIRKIGELIKGAREWYLQQFQSDTELVNEKLKGNRSFTAAEMESMRKLGRQYVGKCEIR